MKWFSNVQTLEELKKQYKKLAMKNYPDVGAKPAITITGCLIDRRLKNAAFR